MNAALTIIGRAAEIRQESAAGAQLVPFEQTTTAQKADPIGRAWAEYHGWRPPVRTITTVEDLDACNDFTILYWLDDAGLPHVYVAVQMKQHWGRLQDVLPTPFWPMTVLHEGGDQR